MAPAAEGTDAMPRVEVLARCCALLGIPREELKASETLAMWHLHRSLAPGVITADSAERLASCFEELRRRFGGALSVTLIAGVAPVQVISSGLVVGRKSLTDILKAIGGAQVDLEIEISKREIIEAFGVPAAAGKVLYYLFVDNLLKLLGAPLQKMEEHLFADRDGSTVVIVSEVDPVWTGKFLAVIGETTAEAGDGPWDALCRKFEQGPRVRQRIDRYHALAEDSLGWVGFGLKKLTPLHVLGEQVRGEGELAARVTGTLARQALHAGLLFTATRAIFDEATGCFSVQYESVDRSVRLELDPSVEVAPEPGSVRRLALWPIQGEGPDRLIVLSRIVTRWLLPGTRADRATAQQNYVQFSESLGRLVNEAAWNYRAFIEGRIDEHFSTVELVADLAAKAAQDLSGALDTVTRGLSETLLATIGVVVLTLLASLVKEEANGSIFLIGMRVYAVYILLVQLIYRMGGIWYSHRLMWREWQGRLVGYRRIVGPQRVEASVAAVQSRRLQFLLWFGLTTFIYLAVAVAIWVLPGILPPEILGSASGAGSPAP